MTEQFKLDFSPPLPRIRLHQVFRSDTNHQYVFTCFQVGHGIINIDKKRFGYKVAICIYDRCGLVFSSHRSDMLTKYGCISWAIKEITQELKHGTL